MNCVSCGHDNPGDAAFCNKCGTRLELTCSVCSRGNPPDSAFCAGCGQRLGDPAVAEPAFAAASPLSYTPRHLAEKILRERTSLQGERRTVTVLFSDAMGFTPLSERIGEEEVYSLMQGCLARMMDVVHRYEGTITQFTGDGVMALFGAPIAHEDSARRAVAAALEMQQSLEEYADEVNKKHPIDCRFRVGLNTGPVVVGSISDNLDMDYTALGDTVNLASRMEEMAQPGTVYLTENTYRIVSDYFDCEPLGSLIVKGKAEPVVAYEALREKSATRTRFQAAAERGLTPFVGREQELRVLNWYFEQLKKGQGHVVLVSGEAGLGKSRLLLEFRRSIESTPVTWLEGHCISYGERVPFLPIIDLIKSSFGIEERDHEADIVQRVKEATARWEESTRTTVPYLKYLLSVDPGDQAVVTMDPMERRAGTLDALRAFLLEQSRGEPLIVVVEDIHWMDEKSQEGLGALVELAASTPVLIILTYRPGYVQPFGERTYYSRLALEHLPPEESATLAERVLQVATLPHDLQRLITSKGEGNPFYIEEVTKSLVESGVLRQTNGSYTLDRPAEEIRVPDTIQEVILSRIDRLEREAKEAIQLASVIGREFTVRLLDRISDIEAKVDDLLVELKSLELIYEKAYFPELAYMFKHALTQDVAYSTLLVEKRRALHRLIGAGIEELYADRLAEQHEALAHHYYEGQDWEKALEYLEKAGNKSVAAYANEEALDYYARALEICEKLGGEAMAKAVSIAEKRGHVHFTIGAVSDAIGDFDRMRSCAQAAGDRRSEGMAVGLRGYMLLWAHDFAAGEEAMREALVIGKEGFGDVTAAANLWMGSELLITGKFEEAQPYLRAADEMVPEVGDPGSVAFWAYMGGMEREWRGQFEESIDHIERWQAALEQSVFTDVGGRWNESLALCGKGEYQRALDVVMDVIARCDRVGETLTRARALNTVGWVLGELQDHETAIEWDKQSEEVALAIGLPDPEVESNARLNIGDSLMALGRLDEAEEYFKLVEEVVRKPRPQDAFALWLYSQHFFHSYGELWLARGDHARALELADECIKLAESTNRPKNVIKGRRLRGQALLAQGKTAEAETDIDIALSIAGEVGNPPQLWKTYVALGDLRKAQGEPDQARKAYREAYSVIETVAEGLTDESLRETFLSSEHVQAIRKAAAAG